MLVTACNWSRAAAFSAALLVIVGPGCGGGSPNPGESVLATDAVDAEALGSIGNPSEAELIATPIAEDIPEELQLALRALPLGTSGTANRIASSTASEGSASLYERAMIGCTPAQTDFLDSPTWNNRRMLPRDCESVPVNPPMFTWRQPPDRSTSKTWTFTLRRATGEAVMVATPTSPAVLLNGTLPVGDYEWSVSYIQKRTGKTVASNARRFRVDVSTPVYLPPAGATIAATVASKAAPRMLAQGATFAGIASIARAGEYSTPYDALLLRAGEALQVALPIEPATPASSLTSGEKNALSTATYQLVLKERDHIERLGMVWQLTRDPRYRDAAVARLVNLANWSPSGSTGYALNDIANSVVITALAHGYDLMYADVSAAQKLKLMTSLSKRISPILPKFKSFDYDPYDSHLVGTVWTVIDALMYVAGDSDFPEARNWLASTWDIFTRVLATWGSEDGSWGNGVAYGWYGFEKLPDIMTTVRVVSGFNLADHPWLKNFGYYLMAHTAPGGAQRLSTGDKTEFTSAYDWYGFDQFRLYAQLTGNPDYEWYWRQGLVQTNPKSAYSIFHLVALGLSLPPPQPVQPTVPRWLFKDAGVVSMFDDPARGALRSAVHFRSSRFGSYNHSLADQNSFTFISRGKDLLISGGYYPYYLSPHHTTVARSTRYKNALTFDGGIGQAEPVPTPTVPGKPMMSMDARGQLINYATSGAWTAATGDATLAYRGWNAGASVWSPLLSNAVRTVAYNRQHRIVVIYDWATSATARRWELNFNALNPFTSDGRTTSVANGTAKACIKVHGPSGTFTSTQGFAVPPENGMPDQFQARFTATNTSTNWSAVTIIHEDCSAVAVGVARTGDEYQITVAGEAPLRLSQRTVALPSPSVQ